MKTTATKKVEAVKPVCNELSEQPGKATPEVTAFSNGCRVTELHLNGKTYTKEWLATCVEEHSALLAVAEAAKPALEELEDLAANGIERTFAESSLVDNGKVVVMLDAATLTVLRDALAALEAVRGGKVVQS